MILLILGYFLHIFLLGILFICFLCITQFIFLYEVQKSQLPLPKYTNTSSTRKMWIRNLFPVSTHSFIIVKVQRISKETKNCKENTKHSQITISKDKKRTKRRGQSATKRKEMQTKMTTVLIAIPPGPPAFSITPVLLPCFVVVGRPRLPTRGLGFMSKLFSKKLLCVSYRVLRHLLLNIKHLFGDVFLGNLKQ